MPTYGRSVSFNATIDVLIIPAMPHAGDDATQHMTATPSTTRCNSWMITWDSQNDVRIIPARQSAPRDDTIPVRELDFDLCLETAEQSVQRLR